MIRLHTDRINGFFVFFSSLSFSIALYTIVFHIGFSLLPLFFIILGSVSYILLKEKAILLFFFLVPVINSFPSFFFNGYSFNLMAPLLFYLSGLIFTSFVKEERTAVYTGYLYERIYFLFLIILWISAFFIFLKWSNITISIPAFLKDTPVSPGSPLPPRNSFASIFPVITLFLYSVAPFTVFLVRRSGINKEKIFKALVFGFSLSFAIAIFQKYINSGFMSMQWWGEKLGQYNGGFSDFNGFGFFSGVIFLYSFILLTKLNILKKKGKIKFNNNVSFYLFSVILSLAGIFFSGSRTASIFLLFALFFFLIDKKFRFRSKLILILILLGLVLLTGSVLEKRVKKSFSDFMNTGKKKDIVSVLNRVTNGRVEMMIDSADIISQYPVSGIGTGNFLFYRKYMKYKSDYLEDLPLNQYLLIIDETGIIGIVLFILFLYFLLRRRTLGTSEGKVLLVIIVALFVGNSFWLPEIFIFFWMLIGFLEKSNEHAVKSFPVKRINYFAVLIIIIFTAGNILSFKQLHPKNLMLKKGLKYNYGFWEESVKSDFQWTKDRSGVFMKLNGKGLSPEFKIFCGAPLDILKERRQSVVLFWRGKQFKQYIFKKNGSLKFNVKGKPYETGFLEIRVSPLFNLNKLGLGPESRDLGIMFFSK